ncbi:hypothetical protein BLEM_1286 [Bifidobacterium lemurum]|uniref:Uncharacterized protein n=2 Tax=Bifidobacterium lemurum TaxID=1603886 RepID=A0A261FRI9_9BIFI|nr:hypothetical protein BLEM_1286 [Bifidobacterium lemurum]
MDISNLPTAGVEAACSLLYILLVVSFNFPRKLRLPAHMLAVVATTAGFFLVYRPIETTYDNYTVYCLFLAAVSFAFAISTLRGGLLNILHLVVTCTFCVVVLKSILMLPSDGINAVTRSEPVSSFLWHVLYYLVLAACGWFFTRFATTIHLPRRYWLILSLCTLSVAIIATLSGQPIMRGQAASPVMTDLIMFWLIMLMYYLTFLITDELGKTHRCKRRTCGWHPKWSSSAGLKPPWTSCGRSSMN